MLFHLVCTTFANAMRRIVLYIIIGCVSLSLHAQEKRDSVPDTPMSDTLNTVVVTEDGRLPIEISNAARERIGTKGVSDVIGSKATDKMMHPFAIQQRKRERHNKKMARILEQYDKVENEHDLLLEALRREGIDPDSLINAYQNSGKK